VVAQRAAANMTCRLGDREHLASEQQGYSQVKPTPANEGTPAMGVALFNECNSTGTQLDRMGFAQSQGRFEKVDQTTNDGL
jgi:hypothetical protein